MNLSRLRAFLTVAELGSFHRAAERLGVSQPALTRQVQVLENEIGATLLRRGRPPLLPTEAGRLVLERGARLLAEAEAMRAEAVRLAGGRDPALSVGVLQSLLEGVFPRAVLDWQTAWAGVPLRVAGFRSLQIMEDVAEGRQHLGFVGAPPADRRLAWRMLADDPFVAVLPAGHALAQRSAVPLAALLRPVLPPQGFGLRTMIDEAFAAAGLRARPTAELEGIGAIVALVRAGLGPGLLPASAVPAMPDVVTRPLEGAAPRRQVGAVWLAQRELGGPMLALVEAMRRALVDALAAGRAHSGG